MLPDPATSKRGWPVPPWDNGAWGPGRAPLGRGLRGPGRNWHAPTIRGGRHNGIAISPWHVADDEVGVNGRPLFSKVSPRWRDASFSEHTIRVSVTAQWRPSNGPAQASELAAKPITPALRYVQTAPGGWP